MQEKIYAMSKLGSTSILSMHKETYNPTQSDLTNLKRTYRDGTDATRLRADHAAHRAHASIDVVIQDELGDLSGLSTPCFPTHHQDTVRVDQLDQLLRMKSWKQQR